MKPYRWKRVLGICTAAVLGLSFPAYAVTITPLNPGTGQSSSSEPSGTGAPASQENTERLNIAQPVVSSEGAVLMDGASGKVLFSKNGDTRYYPASITKLMTALLVAENCSLDDIFSISYYKSGIRSCFHRYGGGRYHDGSPVSVCPAFKVC